MDAQERRATSVSLVVATASMLVTIVVIAVVLWRLGLLFAPTE